MQKKLDLESLTIIVLAIIRLIIKTQLWARSEIK